jgi:ADP-heptose:LPS heptosyltransferase
VDPRFAGVFEDSSDVDEICVSSSLVNKTHPALVLNLHGGTRSMVMTLASGAKYRTGFGHHRYSFIYSHKIPRAQEILGEERPVHTAEHLASAMFWMGVPQREIPRAKLAACAAPNDFGNYVVIHPYASLPEKTWPAQRFVEVARELRQHMGYEPVFLAGPADDPAPFADFRVWRNAPLADVKSLMSGASLFVGNDSGPAHVAAAFGVPVVVLFGPSNPVTWAPWKTDARVMTSREDIARIQTAEVIEAAQSLRAKPVTRTKVNA